MQAESAGTITERLRLRVEQDFPTGGSAPEVIRLVSEATDRMHQWAIAQTTTGTERLQAAMVLGAQGSVPRLRDLIALAEIDWRDLLVSGGLADEDWPSRIDRELGPPRPRS